MATPQAKTATRAKAAVAGEAQPAEQRGFLLKTEVVYREECRIPFSESGEDTIGSMIDKQIKQLADHDGEMRNFSITFDQESWQETKEAYKAMPQEDFYSKRHY